MNYILWYLLHKFQVIYHKNLSVELYYTLKLVFIILNASKKQYIKVIIAITTVSNFWGV
jgi:hypothetical protein